MVKFVKNAFGLIALVSSIALQAQPKPRIFEFPAQVRSTDYGHGYVLAKVKPEHRELLQNPAGRTTSAFPSSTGVRQVRSLVPEKLLLSGRSRQGPRARLSSVDMSLYYEIACDPGRNIEDFINDLYETGYFERVEPDYVAKMTFTPNDPSTGQQYYLENIQAFDAWDVNKGHSTSVMIAIVDSGGDLVHSDLVSNLYTNPADPVDGTDNDGNGFVDDFRGWDFMGADTLNINDPNFVGDNNVQLTKGGLLAHGVSVAGCASASTNNGVGIAGIGFNTKIMFTKHTADNQRTNDGSIYRGYDGILYAAGVGADIINCSWGGSFKSEIIQDIINFVTIDLGSLVVAAAGNNGVEGLFYPAAYDNVLAVAATNGANQKASFSNFGAFVDVSAPGVSIYTTTFNNNYTIINGTSFSSPIAAGVAALVKAQFPSYTALQVAEQVRVSANNSALYSVNTAYAGKLGKGVLDAYSALTTLSPSLRASNPKLLNDAGAPATAGQKGYLRMTFKNLLNATSGALEIKITASSSEIQIINGTIHPGSIGAGGSITNNLTPFEIQIAANVPDNFTLPLTIKYTDGVYSDQETITFILNPTFIDVDENLVTTTVSATGRLGFEDTESSTRTKGSGFVFDQNSLLYEMGIIMGTSTASLYNNVRAVGGVFDKDFVSIGPRISQITPGLKSTSEISGTLSNTISVAQQAFKLDYRSMVWKEAPNDKFVIVEYIVKNTTATPITNFHFGIFADWDITANGQGDAAAWDNTHKMGYVFPAQPAAKPYAGIQVLTGPGEYYAIDNDQAIAAPSFGIYDGFSDAEKIQSISSGLGKTTAGQSTPAGNDVSHVVSTGPYTIAAGAEIKIAFALHAAPNLTELQTSADNADLMYNFTLQAPVPVVANVSVCYGTAALSTATGAPTFKWYKTFTGGASFFTGPSYNTINLFNDTTFYVSNAEFPYESVRAPAKILIKANPTVTLSRAPLICSNEILTLAAMDADTYLWSNGATTKTIDINTAGSYSVTVSSVSPVCQNTSTPVVVAVNPAPVSSFQVNATGLMSHADIPFTDHSTGAVSWSWDFGDGDQSTNQSPSHQYLHGSSYTVTLTVTSAQGCHGTSSQAISVITGLEGNPTQDFQVFPNAFRNTLHVKVNQGLSTSLSVRLVDTTGKTVYSAEGDSGTTLEIPGSGLSEGLYILHVGAGARVFAVKVLRIP